MAKVTQQNVFARLSGVSVLEFPVTSEMIRNRNAPLSMFAQVVWENDPDVGPYQKHTVALRVHNKQVFATVVVEDMNLDELLVKILSDAKERDYEITRELISNVPMQTVMQVSKLTEQETLRRLNALAQQRRYETIDSASSFKFSHIEKYQKEAERMIFLRSQVFADLESYEVQVVTDQLPVPLTADEIFSHLTPINWGELEVIPTAVVEPDPEPSQEVAPPSEESPNQDPVDPIMTL